MASQFSSSRFLEIASRAGERRGFLFLSQRAIAVASGHFKQILKVQGLQYGQY